MDWSVDFDNFDGELKKWFHPGSNMLLDFHGDPVNSDLVVFSDGNHNMALKETLQQFKRETPEMEGFFYVTTPPGPIVQLLKSGKLQIGNFILSVKPDVFISPPNVLDKLVKDGYMKAHMPFVKNQGNVLLVKKGNPKKISSVDDLKQKDITVFLSNSETEKVSYGAYFDTLKNLSKDDDLTGRINFHYGNMIHHREAPESVQSGVTEAAVIFYHLALHYTRLFPDEFEIIPLGGTIEKPDPVEGNIIGKTHAGIIGDGGKFGSTFLEFLMSKKVREIYRYHGLLHIKE